MTKPWRERYVVHPVADVRPMMDLDSKEFADFKADIKENGVRVAVEIWLDGDGTRWLMGGRHRLEAADQLGLKSVPEQSVFCSDPYSWAISLNAARRHMSKEELADYVVAVLAAKAAAEALTRQDGETIEKRKRGGQVDKIKAAAIATGKQHGISKRTIERSLSKIKGRPKKKRPKTYPVPDDIAAMPDDQVQQLHTPCGTPIEGATMTGAQMKEAFRTGQMREERATLTQCDAAVHQVREWARAMLFHWQHLPKGVPAGVPAEHLERWREWIAETRKALDIADTALAAHAEAKDVAA